MAVRRSFKVGAYLLAGSAVIAGLYFAPNFRPQGIASAVPEGIDLHPLEGTRRDSRSFG